MDIVDFLVGFILASLLWLFIAAAFSAGKQAAYKGYQPQPTADEGKNPPTTGSSVGR